MTRGYHGSYREAETGQYSRRSVLAFRPCFHGLSRREQRTTTSEGKSLRKTQGIRAMPTLCLYSYIMSSATFSRVLSPSFVVGSELHNARGDCGQGLEPAAVDLLVV